MPASLAQLFGDRPALTLTTCKAAVTGFQKSTANLTQPNDAYFHGSLPFFA